jgi:hypothetical protein
MFNEYPYRNLTDLNLDYILHAIKTFHNELTNFVNFNAIKYADPIQWNITTQYEANTVVIDGATGNAYLSTHAVPSGVAISNADYWTVIFNYDVQLSSLREQIAAADEGASTTATRPRAVGDLVWLNGRLAVVNAAMIAGDSYVENSNFTYTTIEELIKNVYYPTQELLKINAIIDGEADISVGDVHTYSESTSTISITEG